MRKSLSLSIVVCCFSSAANGQSLVGPEWVEQGDAGSLPTSSQAVTVNGAVSQIRGQLAGSKGPFDGGISDFEDMYRIVITVPTAFYLRTDPTSGGGADFNTQLWVFNTDGLGVLGNDDASNPGIGSAVFQFATDGTRAGIYEPGEYLIAISGLLNVPTSNGQHIFFFASPTEISGPDGQGGGGPIDGWDNNPDCQFGDYIIAMQGVSGVPGPGVLAGIVGGLMLRRRSRRRSN